MKSVLKLVRRFIGILVLSFTLILVINLIVLVVAMSSKARDQEDSPYYIAKNAGKSLQKSESGEYSLSENMVEKLKEHNVWATLIENETLQIAWKTDNVPSSIPKQYTLSEIADLSVGYLKGYPTYTGENEHGIIVLGFPKDSFWKHTRASWDYHLIANLPQPLMKKQENVIAIVRQVVVDFMNMNIDDKFPIEWKTDDQLTVCSIDVDKDLLKRAITNLIQNSMDHNENGCTIFVSVNTDQRNCVICVEDNGIGATDEQINRLSYAPHYMVCDTNTTEQRHGLGLLIVKQIMDGHNGKTVIGHSEYGGFKVMLTMPCYQKLIEF